MFLKIVPLLFVLFFVGGWFVYNKYFKKPAPAAVVSSPGAAQTSTAASNPAPAAAASGGSASTTTVPTTTTTAPPAATLTAPNATVAALTTYSPNTLGFIPVLAGITQADIVGDGFLCSVLALPYLLPESAAYWRVKLNCDRDSFAEAETKALGQTIFANTAYDVDLQPDGSYKLNPNKVLLKNWIVPTEVNTDPATVAFCNAYPVTVGHWSQPAPGAADGKAIALEAARRAKKAGGK